MRHLNITVGGKVQGVFFRASTKQKADELGINGTVRNEPGGIVFIQAEGHDGPLKEFLAWLHVGPPMARVSSVQVEEGEFDDLGDFVILR